MNKRIMFIDAETDGLYGEFISVGIVIVDGSGSKIEEHYLGRNLSQMTITSDWVKEHVIPQVGAYDVYDSSEELLNQVWDIWLKQGNAVDVIADVSYPVECRLWEACVRLDLKKREFQAPFPLLDLSSMLYAKGIDPIQSRKELVKMDGIEKQHNALYDAQIAAKIWMKYILPQCKDHKKR